MGGFVNKDHMLKATMAGGKALKNKLLNDNDFKLYWSNLTSSQMKIRHKMGLVKYDNFKGKIHSKETKAKMSESSKGIGIGKNNSQYGTCWITNGVKNKKIKKEEIDIYLKTGWFKGRKT
jgi:hypothetical protein